MKMSEGGENPFSISKGLNSLSHCLLASSYNWSFYPFVIDGRFSAKPGYFFIHLLIHNDLRTDEKKQGRGFYAAALPVR